MTTNSTCDPSIASNSTFQAVYRFIGDPKEAEKRAHSLAIEQSHELARAYAPAEADRSLARVVRVNVVSETAVDAIVEYPEELTAFEIPQLLIVLLGNVSLLPRLRLIDINISTEFARKLGGGPRLGVEGIRNILQLPQRRPLLATALKPVGLNSTEIAQEAYDSALGGIDIIKDDHGLANQVWSRFSQRVPLVADAVRRANDSTGRHSVYLPTFNPPVDHWREFIDIALKAGVGGFLVEPGSSGFDVIRYVKANTPDDFIIYAHPAFLGGWTASQEHGIAPELLFGHLLRLLGADSVIFPSFGGRFTFSEDECRAIADASRDDFAGLRRSLPSPAGGMTIERVPELVEFYGLDVLLLIGGALHATGSIREGARRFSQAALQFAEK